MFQFRLVVFMERWTQQTISLWPRGRPFQFLLYTHKHNMCNVHGMFSLQENCSVLSSSVPVVILYVVYFDDFFIRSFIRLFFFYLAISFSWFE